FEFPIGSNAAAFSIRPQLARLGIRTVTVLRFLPSANVVRTFEYLGNPGLIWLDPRWYQAALQFVKLGFHHVLAAADHLLFLCCLVLPLSRFRAIAAAIVSFTAAYS